VIEPLGAAQAPLDDTAEPAAGAPATRAADLAARAALLRLLGTELDRVADLRTARMRDRFNASEGERAELLREMNALRDMAMEQMKKDDEVLKKFIALI
jgi:hypothetical protein